MAALNQFNGKPHSENFPKTLDEQKKLPIWKCRQNFMELLAANQTLMVVGTAGAGKTTQIPQWAAEYVHSIGAKPVACSVPKRGAAVGLAEQVARQMDVELGTVVGFGIRFEERQSAETILKFLTDGALLREAVESPRLERYAVVIVAVAGEPGFCTTVLLALLKKWKTSREDLKIVIISENVDSDRLEKYFGDCKRMDIPTDSAEPMPAPPEANAKTERASLAAALLLLKKIGIENLADLDFLDSPAPDAVASALRLLIDLEAFDQKGVLTELGSLMAGFPLEPPLAKALFAAAQLHCADEVSAIVAMLSVPSGFLDSDGFQSQKSKIPFSHSEGDHLTLLNVFNAFKTHRSQQWCQDNGLSFPILQRADNIRSQLHQLMEKLNPKAVVSPPLDNSANIRKALLAGLCHQVARLQPNGSYLTLEGNQLVNLHSTVVFAQKPEWILYSEILPQNQIRMVSAIRAEWFHQMAPQYFDGKDFPIWDMPSGQNP